MGPGPGVTTDLLRQRTARLTAVEIDPRLAASLREDAKGYKYLIIGGGITADCAVRGIRQLDGEGSIGLIGEEPYPPYDRPPLSTGLWRGDSAEDIWRNTQEQGVARDIGGAICSDQVRNGSIQVAHLDTLRCRFEDVKWSNGWYRPTFGSTPEGKIPAFAGIS